MKRCIKCGNLLPLDCFHRDAHRKDGHMSSCKECEKLRWSQCSQERKEQRRKRMAEHYQTHKEQITKRQNQYREAHKEEDVQYRQKNKAKIAEYKAQYAKEHATQIAEYKAQYRQTETGRLLRRSANHRRRAREKASSNSFTAQQFQEQIKRQKNKCYYCGKRPKKGKQWHVEHVIPLSRGGSNTIDNIVASCPTCNLSKGNKLPHEWAKGGKLL